MQPVFRAPMRSRRDDIDPAAAVEWALAEALCGVGGVMEPAPGTVEDAVVLARHCYDERLARRLRRFADAPRGARVWTRDGDGLFWVGELTGPWRYDSIPAAVAVDLVHVRDCRWHPVPFEELRVPDAVRATFARGGRNWQQIHGAGVEAQTRALLRET